MCVVSVLLATPDALHLFKDQVRHNNIGSTVGMNLAGLSFKQTYER